MHDLLLAFCLQCVSVVEIRRLEYNAFFSVIFHTRIFSALREECDCRTKHSKKTILNFLCLALLNNLLCIYYNVLCNPRNMNVFYILHSVEKMRIECKAIFYVYNRRDLRVYNVSSFFQRYISQAHFLGASPKRSRCSAKQSIQRMYSTQENIVFIFSA